MTASEECSNEWNPIGHAPVRSEVKTDDLTSPSKDCGQGPTSVIDGSCPTERAGSKDEAEKLHNLMEDVEDTFEEPHHFPSAVATISALQNVPIEREPDPRGGDQTSQQPIDSPARAAGLSETVEMDTFRQGAQPCHSSIDPRLGGSQNIGEQPGADAAAPSGTDENGNVSSWTRSIDLV